LATKNRYYQVTPPLSYTWIRY